MAPPGHGSSTRVLLDRHHLHCKDIRARPEAATQWGAEDVGIGQEPGTSPATPAPLGAPRPILSLSFPATQRADGPGTKLCKSASGDTNQAAGQLQGTGGWHVRVWVGFDSLPLVLEMEPGPHMCQASLCL